MKRIINLGLLLLLLLGGQAFGQTIRVTGTVTDAKDGNTLPGVTVAVKGTTQGTVTNIDGRYELNTTGDATLVFSFIGMKTQEIPVEGRNVINVAMESDIQALSEVVVIGYGTARSVGTVVGSISTVSAAELESKPVANVWDAMQGRVAGLQVFTSSGEPSQISSIRLHGAGSLGSSSAPLYVLDGIPVDAGNVLSLNPNDFESVTVLKDASATSIYGSRAANGVIYITTKRGHRDTKATITVNAQTGTSSFANEDFFNRFMNTEQLTNFWVETGFQTQEQVDNLLEQYPNDTKWHKYYYQESAPTHQGDISIQGGGGRTTYYVSGAYFYQDGLATRSEFERYNLRANINSSANDWLSFGTNLGLGSDTRQTNQYGWNSTNRGLAMLAQPFYTPYDSLGNPFEGVIPGWNRYDPYYLEEKLPATGDNLQVNLSGYIQLNPLEGLTIRSQGGIDGYDYRTTSYRLPSFIGDLNNGSAREYFSRNYTRTLTNTAEYKFNLDLRHDFTLLAGQEYVDNTFESFAALSTGQTDDRLLLLTAGPENRDVEHSKSEYAFASYFGRFEYGFNERYFFDASVRQDASSRFGRENQVANFWATGVMWNAKKEGFLENVDFLSSLQLKASIGTSGNSQIGNYLHLANMGTTQYDGNTGWLISSPGNPRLTWEKQTKATVGAKFSMVEDRFRFNIEYYRRATESMLVNVPQPYTSGFANIYENVGTLQNNGIDIEFDFDIVSGRDYYVTPYFNFNYNENKVTELFQGLDYWIIPNTGVAWVVGQPVAFYYPIFAGVDPLDGAPMWYVPGEDRMVNTEEETTKDFDEAALQQNTGLKRYPPVSGGFGLNAGWKSFSVQVDFAFVNGKYLINNDRYFYENPNVFSGFNQSEVILDYWKEPGDETRFPSYDYQFTQFDSRLVEDASFMRMKNLTIGYELPESLLQRTNLITGSRIFITGRNLLTFTNYEGPDPEVDSNLTLGVNPNTRQISFGLSLQF